MPPEIQTQTTDAPDPEIQAAEGFLDRAAARAGVDLDSEPEEPPTPVAARNDGLSEAGREMQDGFVPHRPDFGRANESWRERQDRRRQEAKLAAQEELLGRLAQQLESLPAGQAAPAAEAEDDDPEPDPLDYAEHQAWSRRQVVKELRGELDGKLKPILGFFEHQRQEAERRAQEGHQEARRRAWMREMGEMGREATRMYVETPEGQGFGERLALWFGAPGRPANPETGEPARPPFDGALATALMQNGMEPERARRFARGNVHALQDLAMQINANPAALIDSIIRAEMEHALYYAQGQGLAAPAQQQQATPAPPQTPAGREIANLRQTASARGVTGSAVAAASAGADESIAGILRSGDLDQAKIREIARKKGWTFQQAAQILRQEAAKLRAAG